VAVLRAHACVPLERRADIVRGEGCCHLEDTDGNRYLGAVAGAKDD
jgi:hypothetical protein